MLNRLGRHDHRLIGALAGVTAPPWVDRALRLVTHAGGASATTLACLALLAAPGTRRLGVVAGMANLVSHLMVQVLKRAVVRPRPTVDLPHLTALAALPDQFSFPSGHACAAASLAVALLLANPLAGLPAMLLALLVGASRVYLRVHYPTDVVVGQLLGAVTAAGFHWSLS